MKTIWKALLIIFLVLLVIFFIIAGVVGYTIYQGYQVKEKADNLVAEINSLENCENPEDTRNSVYELRDEIKSSCKNPILKWAMEKNIRENLCVEVENEEYVNLAIEEIEKKCDNSSI